MSIAEHSGLIGAAMRGLVLGAAPRMVTVTVVFTGIVSNTAAELGYVVLIPMAAAIFHSLGRHPLAGLAAAFAGVSGGYSANLFIGTVDPLLAGFTEAAARLLDPTYTVGPEANWFFMIASTFLITILGAIVTEKIVEPKLGNYNASGAEIELDTQELQPLTAMERRALKGAGLVFIGLLALIAITVVPAWGVLRHPVTGELAGSPFLKGVVVYIFITFAIPGLVYGRLAGTIRNDRDAIDAMARGMSSMGLYIVLVFFAAQFVAFFGWSNLGAIFAVKGATFLQELGLTGPLLFLLFIAMCGVVNLTCIGSQATGRTGLPVETVLRCAILKQVRQVSYKELAFYLEDSGSFRSFARLPQSVVPKKSALQNNISRIKPETWERINQALVGRALADKVEHGEQVRIDSTVVETNIHDPSDSSLLSDGIRMLTRLLMQAKKKLEVPEIGFTDHRKSARGLSRQIFYTRGMAKKKPLYVELLSQAEQVMKDSSEALWRVQLYRFRGPKYGQWIVEVKYYRRLLRRVIRQSRRRVLNGDSVPATEKVVSLYEAHTDIIVKGSRDIQYGHKLNLTTGQEGLVLDATIESGNPCDTVRYLPMVRRQEAIYGRLPDRVAADGGYASTANLAEAKALGVSEVAFQKKKGLTIDAMTSSQKVYKQLCDFRAGIEGNISELKRAYGLRRSLWRGLRGFMADVWSSIVSYNLVRIARLNSS